MNETSRVADGLHAAATAGEPSRAVAGGDAACGPRAIEPGTATPNRGVTDRDARDMATYLYTLA